MDVPRIPPVSPAGGDAPAPGDHAPGGGGDLPFGLGQRLFARVVQALDAGRAVLEVGGERFLATTPLAVRAGDVLAVVVRGLSPVVELAVEAPPVAFSERAYAIAAIRQALQQAAPAAGPLTPDELGALAHALARAARGAGPAGAAVADRVLAQLRPIPLDRDAAGLADRIRDRVATGGAFFEAHVARAGPGAAAVVPAAMQADVRWLLAALAEATRADPALEPLRQRLVDEVGLRQLETALARVKDGELRVAVPVTFGAFESAARLVVKDDGEGAAPDARPSGRAIALTVTHPDFGPVHATATWQPGDLHVRLAVRDDAAAAALTPDVGELEARLRRAGFRHAGVAVVVDPHAADPPPERPAPEDPPPGGSIVSALA